MPAVTLHTDASDSKVSLDDAPNNLPTILKTPSGLAILEIQGTIHAPFPETGVEDLTSNESSQVPVSTSIGRLEFPLFNPLSGSSDLKWMKRVYLYVGKHQRLTGEVKKLPKPLVVVGKRTEAISQDQMSVDVQEDQQDQELEILEIIRHKILFGGRPEPVGD